MNTSKRHTRYYNIHNILTFKIAHQGGLLAWRFKNIFNQYRQFESADAGNHDFEVYLGDFVPSNQDCYITDGKYFIRENYIYCERDAYKLARWRFELSGFETGMTVVHIVGNLWFYLFMCGFIIDFLIHFAMNAKGYPTVHAACISGENRAHLLAARSGGGKTTIASYLVENGYRIVADNFTILHSSHVLGLPSPVNVFTYNLTPFIRRNLSRKQRLTLLMMNLLNKATLGYIKLFVKIDIGRAFEKSSTSHALASVLLLIPQEGYGIESISRDDMVNHLVANQELETLLFFRYLSEYAYYFPEHNLASYWKRYRRNLEEALAEDCHYYKVTVPPRKPEAILDKLLELIKNASNSKL